MPDIMIAYNCTALLIKLGQLKVAQTDLDQPVLKDALHMSLMACTVQRQRALQQSSIFP